MAHLRTNKLHPSITLDRVVAAVERHASSLDDPGFCLVCGEDAMNVEPDASNDECESCGALAVFGAEQVLLLIQA